MRLKPNALLITAILMLLFVANLPIASAETRILFKTAPLDSVYYQIALRFAEVMETHTNSRIIIDVETSQAAVENVKDAAAYAESYLFITPPELIDLAVAGEDPFSPSEHYADIRSLFPLPELDAQPAAVYALAVMNEELAYTLTKSFWDNKDTIAQTEPSIQALLQAISPKMLAQLGTVLHSGALRYYRENGIGIPRHLQQQMY